VIPSWCASASARARSVCWSPTSGMGMWCSRGRARHATTGGLARSARYRSVGVRTQNRLRLALIPKSAREKRYSSSFGHRHEGALQSPQFQLASQ
jgi:hypothetical protein